MSPRRDTSTYRWVQEGVYAGGYTIHDIRREPLLSLALSKGGLLERVAAMLEATVECLRAK